MFNIFKLKNQHSKHAIQKFPCSESYRDPRADSAIQFLCICFLEVLVKYIIIVYDNYWAKARSEHRFNTDIRFQFTNKISWRTIEDRVEAEKIYKYCLENGFEDLGVLVNYGIISKELDRILFSKNCSFNRKLL